jgi:hypothetical protein
LVPVFYFCGKTWQRSETLVDLLVGKCAKRHDAAGIDKFSERHVNRLGCPYTRRTRIALGQSMACGSIDGF